MKKKLILLALTAVIMAGVYAFSKKERTRIGTNAEVVTMDGCEYIESSTYMGYSIYIHKGNCKYCAARRKQELQSIVEQLKNK